MISALPVQQRFLQAFEVFKTFYLAKHSGRILTLQPSAGTADLNATFFGKRREGEEEAEAGGSDGGENWDYDTAVSTLHCYVQGKSRRSCVSTPTRWSCS